MTEPEIQRWLVMRFAEELGVPESAIDLKAHVSRLALDSVRLLSIAGELEDALGAVLPTEALWDCASLEALASVAHRQQRGGPGTA
ncbi:MAG: acyl carrier protein [Myxococcaceae bacterium]|nr:acyl carrier protein [Myxococcaceae bacterium]